MSTPKTSTSKALQYILKETVQHPLYWLEDIKLRLGARLVKYKKKQKFMRKLPSYYANVIASQWVDNKISELKRCLKDVDEVIAECGKATNKRS
jgi:hypothetical protein